MADAPGYLFNKCQKDFKPDGSDRQRLLLENVRAEERKRLLLQRIVGRNTLTLGQWIPDRKRVQIKKAMGSFWSQMGYCELGNNFLYPEEALFLIEEGKLVLTNEDVMTSVQKAYATLLGVEVSVAAYQAYAYLLRAGYIVRRCLKAPLNSNEPRDAVEKPTEMAQQRGAKRKQSTISKTSWKSKRMRRNDKSMRDFICGKNELHIQDERLCDTGIKDEVNCHIPMTSIGFQHLNTAETSDEHLETSDEHLETSDKHLEMWHLFPDCAHKDEIVLERPHQSLLPENVLPSWERRSFNCRSLINQKLSCDGDVETTYCRNCYISEHRDRFHDLNFYDQSGMRDSIQPLLLPSDLESFDSTYAKLQISPEFTWSQQQCKSAFYQQLSFEVYKPRKNFAKTRAGTPDYYLFVAESVHSVLTVNEICCVDDQLNGVPAIVAVVDHGTVSFYFLNSANIENFFEFQNTD